MVSLPHKLVFCHLHMPKTVLRSMEQYDILICAAESIRHTNCVFSLAPSDVMSLLVTCRKLLMHIIEPAPMLETSASSTLVKMNYSAFVALSLMSVQAGKIFQVFTSFTRARFNCDVSNKTTMARLSLLSKTFLTATVF